MALSAHLQELAHKHTQLDEKIQSEMRHAAPDTVQISRLKKQKLLLKEKIQTYQAQTAV